MQDYKSLRIAVMICATLVNTQTHRHRQLLTGYTISSASKAKFTIVHDLHDSKKQLRSASRVTVITGTARNSKATLILPTNVVTMTR